MRVLILGGAGMLGHRLFLHLRREHEVRVTLRQELARYARHGWFDDTNAYSGVDAQAHDRILDIIGEFRPEAIVNCIGIVKQLPVAKESIPSIEINALLPHRLALLARAGGARLVHVSTDCVFSGRTGRYRESDPPDPEDLYGRTKLLGEVSAPHCITLRTSLIGHEIERKTSLVEWFLAQQGPIRGYRNAIFSGFTTAELSRIIGMLLAEHPEASGVWHVSSDPIDKYALLTLVRNHYRRETQIIPDDEFRCDRSLDSSRFRRQFGYLPPSWDEMIEEMSRMEQSKQ